MGDFNITYEDKVGIVPKKVHKNQVWDQDMNEVKKKHNDLDNYVADNIWTASKDDDGVVTVTKKSNNDTFNISKAGQSGKLTDLDTQIGAVEFNIGANDGVGNSSGFIFGSQTFSVQSDDPLSALVIRWGGVLLSAFNGLLNFAATNIIGNHPFSNYIENTLITKKFSEDATEFRDFGTINYLDNSGVLEDNLNALVGDYFLVKNDTDFYIAVKKTNNFDPRNATISIAGDLVNGRASIRITNPTLNVSGLAASYNFYNISAPVLTGLSSAQGYRFTFWRNDDLTTYTLTLNTAHLLYDGLTTVSCQKKGNVVKLNIKDVKRDTADIAISPPSYSTSICTLPSEIAPKESLSFQAFVSSTDSGTPTEPADYGNVLFTILTTGNVIISWNIPFESLRYGINIEYTLF